MDESTSQMSSRIFKEFQQLQQERWDNIDNLLGREDDIDKLLVDIANLALALYTERKIMLTNQKSGFQSFNKEKQ